MFLTPPNLITVTTTDDGYGDDGAEVRVSNDDRIETEVAKTVPELGLR